MPSMTTATRMSCLLLACALLGAGCGNPNATATFDPETSHHPSDWMPAGHMLAAQGNADSCRNCHGQDLTSGGIAKISCTGCHLGGPLSKHLVEWNGHQTTLQMHGTYAIQNGTGSCKNVWCHGPTLQGVPFSGPSCNLCHTFT